MKCISCKKDIIQGMLYCPYCNTKQPVTQNVELPQLKVPSRKAADHISSDTAVFDVPVLNKNIEHTNTTITSEQINSITNEIDTTSVKECPNAEDKDFEDVIVSQSSLDSTKKEDDNDFKTASESQIDNNKEDDNDIKTDDDYDSADKKVKKKKFFSKKEKIDKSQKDNILNKDGYYTEMLPIKTESFPVSKGEFVAKIIFSLLGICILVLFLIYFIQ